MTLEVATSESSKKQAIGRGRYFYRRVFISRQAIFLVCDIPYICVFADCYANCTFQGISARSLFMMRPE